MTVSHATRKHAPISPSQLPALERCPCYQSDELGSDAAAYGERQHEALEELLKNAPAKPHFAALDEFAQGSVKWAANAILEMADGEEIHIETPVEIYRDVNADWEPLTWGTADVWFVKGGAVTLIDYKSGGLHDYDAQLLAYAAGILQNLAMAGRSDIEICRPVILYGRTRTVLDLTPPVTMEQALAGVVGIIDRATAPGRQPCPCDYCAWCGARIGCPAITRAVAPVVRDLLPEVESIYFPAEITRNDAIAPAAISRYMEVADRLETWAKGVKAYVRSILESGGELPGWELKENASVRDVVDIKAAFSAAADAGIAPDAIIAVCDIGIGALEKAAAAAWGFKGVGSAKFKEKFSEIFGDFIRLKPRAASIVRCAAPPGKEDKNDGDHDLTGANAVTEILI